MGNAEADHTTPLSRGGSKYIENLQIVTMQVNRAKGQMTNEEFVDMCCKVASHVGGYIAPTDNREGLPE